MDKAYAPDGLNNGIFANGTETHDSGKKVPGSI